MLWQRPQSPLCVACLLLGVVELIVVGVFRIEPRGPATDHLAIDVNVANPHTSDDAAITVYIIVDKCEIATAHQLRELGRRFCAVGLIALGRIDRLKPEIHDGALHFRLECIAVDDGHKGSKQNSFITRFRRMLRAVAGCFVRARSFGMTMTVPHSRLSMTAILIHTAWMTGCSEGEHREQRKKAEEGSVGRSHIEQYAHVKPKRARDSIASHFTVS